MRGRPISDPRPAAAASCPRRSRPGTVLCLLIVLLAAVALPQAAGGAVGVAERRSQVARLQTQLEDLDRAAGAAVYEHNRAVDRLSGARLSLRRTEGELTRVRADLRESRDRLARRLVALYKKGEPSVLDLIAGSGSLTELEATVDALARIGGNDARMVRAVALQRERLTALRARRERERAQAARDAEVAQARKGQLLSLVARRRAVLEAAESDLRRAILVERRRLARLAALKRARLSAERARAAAADREAGIGGGTTAVGAGHVFPIKGGTNFSDDWLAPRAGGRYHEGIDLFADRGTPVVAVADGTLFRVGWNRMGGWRLWLRDQGGTEFYYAHLDSYASAAREGAFVRRGTVIGFNGDSGDARGTPPHVHFQIHPGGGSPVRPFPIVAAWPRP